MAFNGFDDIQVSLHGRRLGLDKDSFLRVRGEKLDVTAGTTAANLPAYGIVTLGSTAAGAYTLDAPIPGVEVQLHATGATTAARTITCSTGTIGGSATVITMTSTSTVGDQSITLVGLSKTRFGVVAKHGTSTVVTS